VKIIVWHRMAKSIWQPCSQRHRNFENRVGHFSAL